MPTCYWLRDNDPREIIQNINSRTLTTEDFSLIGLTNQVFFFSCHDDSVIQLNVEHLFSTPMTSDWVQGVN